MERLLATANPIEVLWTVIAFYGIWLAANGLVAATGDVTWLVANNINQERLILAVGRKRRKLLYLGIMVLYTLVGLYSLTVPPRPDQPVAVGAILIALVFLASEIGIVIEMHQTRRETAYLIELGRLRNRRKQDAVVQEESC